MKKWICSGLCLLLLCAVVIPVCAAELPVVFTADSQPAPGFSMTVDKNAMMNMDSISYNDMLEGNVIYNWYKNGLLHNSGISARASFTSSWRVSSAWWCPAPP